MTVQRTDGRTDGLAEITGLITIPTYCCQIDDISDETVTKTVCTSYGHVHLARDHTHFTVSPYI